MIAAISIAYIACSREQYFLSACISIVAGGSGGFLLYNTYPAKMRIGHSGSQFMGCCFSYLTLMGEIPIKGATVMTLFVPIVVLGATCIRSIDLFFKGRKIRFTQNVFYKKILRENFTYKRTLLLVCCINGIMAIVAMLYSKRYIIECIGLCIVGLMLLYILITNTSSRNISVKAVNTMKQEKKD